MKIDIKSPSLGSSLFWGWPTVFYFICLLTKFCDREIASPVIVVLGLIVALVGYRRIRLGYFQLVFPLIAVAVIGAVGFGGYLWRDVLRDYSFALTPIALLSIGSWVASKNENHHLILKSLLVCGAFLACLHLAGVLQNFELLKTGEGAGALRGVVSGPGGFLFIIAVASFFMYGLAGKAMFPKFLPFAMAFPLMLISCFLTFSRTGFMVAVGSFLAFIGALDRVKFKTIIYLFVVAAGFILLVITTPEDDNKSFRGKLANSIRETAISNYEEQVDINQNWRGFEANKGIETFLSGSVKQQILGQGFGAVADLGFDMPLGGSVFRHIPVFHNGYVYVLLKTGWLGFFLYLLFFFKLIKRAVGFCVFFKGENRFFSRMLLSCILALILSMFVVGGMAQMADTLIVLLVGYLYKMLLQKKTYRIQAVRE